MCKLKFNQIQLQSQIIVCKINSSYQLSWYGTNTDVSSYFESRKCKNKRLGNRTKNLYHNRLLTYSALIVWLQFDIFDHDLPTLPVVMITRPNDKRFSKFKVQTFDSAKQTGAARCCLAVLTRFVNLEFDILHRLCLSKHLYKFTIFTNWLLYLCCVNFCDWFAFDCNHQEVDALDEEPLHNLSRQGSKLAASRQHSRKNSKAQGNNNSRQKDGCTCMWQTRKQCQIQEAISNDLSCRDTTQAWAQEISNKSTTTSINLSDQATGTNNTHCLCSANKQYI